MLHPIKRKKGETEEARGARKLIIKLKDEGKGEGREHNNSSNPSEIILQQGPASLTSGLCRAERSPPVTTFQPRASCCSAIG